MAGVDGCVAVGELRYVWQRGLIENRLCGCGETFSTCAFWKEVVARAFPDGDVDSHRFVALQDRGTRMRQLPATFASRRRARARLEDYPEVLSRLVRAIADVAGAHTVVDSSKLPPYGAILRLAPDIDLRVVHLVRDPRATAYSWQQAKDQPDRGVPGTMQRQSAVKSALLWSTWNSAAEALGRSLGASYLRLQYEDLIADPETSLRAVLRLIGTPDSALPLVEPHRVALAQSHTVAGNPDRFHSGAVDLRPDERWKSAMSPRSALAVQLLTAPLMLRYGYQVGRSK